MPRKYKIEELVFAKKPTSKSFKDLSGLKFNKLTIIGYAELHKHGYSSWFCECECGNIVKVFGSCLKGGHTKACGCLMGKGINSRTMTARTGTNTSIRHNNSSYDIWRGIKKRCLNPNSKEFKNYGGRGIDVCERWIVFKNFSEDMGERPKDMTIERINNNKGYYKENCRWATRMEQGSNKRNNVFIKFNGKTQTLAQWSREMKIHSTKLRQKMSELLSGAEIVVAN
jgi:hypothetical protein